MLLRFTPITGPQWCCSNTSSRCSAGQLMSATNSWLSHHMLPAKVVGDLSAPDSSAEGGATSQDSAQQKTRRLVLLKMRLKINLFKCIPLMCLRFALRAQ